MIRIFNFTERRRARKYARMVSGDGIDVRATMERVRQRRLAEQRATTVANAESLEALAGALIESVSRVEVIDDSGRAYVKYTNGTVRLALQDDARTLKIFITIGATA